ncbi:MAG: hypothetical protein KJ667_08235 [Alphaproteobacteria bacterium]|nr:hypothetical protein [Alphaproteobacteria bacterium]
MSHNLDNQEVIRLATIVSAFNKAAEANVGQDFDAQAKLQQAMTPELATEIQSAMQDLMQMAMNMMMTGQNEQNEAEVAAKSIAIINTVLVAVQNAGLEDKFASFFPATEKTEANAESFRKLGAENVARLCLK